MSKSDDLARGERGARITGPSARRPATPPARVRPTRPGTDIVIEDRAAEDSRRAARAIVQRLRGAGDVPGTTDEILALTRPAD